MINQSYNDISEDSKRPHQHNPSYPVDITLTYEQHMILQHFLPKGYTLLEYKSTKKTNNGSAVKANTLQDVNYQKIQPQNLSKLSGNYDNTQNDEGRSKRPRPKKLDRFLQNQAPQKSNKRSISERIVLNLDEQMIECLNILTQVKKHKSAYPFHRPVDPKNDGAQNYLDIVKEPMDLSTVQSNLKNGQYQTVSQFHGDINKIWLNSYAYNQKTSQLYKLTVEVQKYYNNLCSNEGINKKAKAQQKSKNKQSKHSKKDSILQKNTEKESLFRQIDRKSFDNQQKDQNNFAESDQFLDDK